MFGASRELTFARDGADWPNREASAFVEARGLRWHVQTMGTGPDVLMVHGTGASTHSWEGLAPLLAQRFRLVAPDLPGHGFTQAKRTPDLSLPGMARALAVPARRAGILPEDRDRPFGGGGDSRAPLPRRDDFAEAFREPQRGLSTLRGYGPLFCSLRWRNCCFSIRSRRVFLPGPPTRPPSPTCSKARDRRSDRAASISMRAFSTIPPMSPARWA